MLKKQQKRYRRHKRVRAKIFGTALRPRLYAFRSSNHICAQLIDDEKGITLAAATDRELISSKPSFAGRSKRKIKEAEGAKQKKAEKETEAFKGKIGLAFEVGKLIAQKALKKKIERVVFDRGGYVFHGRVKAVAEGARKGGLKF